MRTLLFANLQSTVKSLFVMIEDIIDLVNSHKLTVLQVEVTPLVALHKRLGHGYDDISWLVSLLIHPSDCKMQLLGLFIVSELLVLGQDTLEGILKNVGVYNDHALRHEYLVLLHFALATLPHNYNSLSLAVGKPLSMLFKIGTINAIVLPDPFGARISMLNFLRSGLTVTSRVYDCTRVGVVLPSS